MAHEELINGLRAACGDDNVITHPHQLRTYESDGLLRYRVTPRAVVLPGSTVEVQAVLRACHVSASAHQCVTAPMRVRSPSSKARGHARMSGTGSEASGSALAAPESFRALVVVA